MNTLYIRAGGRLTGNGTITGRVVNEGTMELDYGANNRLRIVGNLDNYGLVRVSNGTGITVTGTLANYAGGVFDASTAGSADAGSLVNQGTYIGAGEAQVRNIQTLVPGSANLVITMQTFAGHNYQLQRSNSLAPPQWVNVGAPVAGTGAVVNFSDGNAMTGSQVYYRVVVYP